MLTPLALPQPLPASRAVEEAVARHLPSPRVRIICPRRAVSPSHRQPACHSHLLVPPVRLRSPRSPACPARRLPEGSLGAPRRLGPVASLPRLASPVDNILLLILRRFVGGYVKPMPG